MGNETILNLINQLPDYMIEEWQSSNLFPYKKETMNILLGMINERNKELLYKNFSLEDFGYTNEVCDMIETLYKEIEN